MMQIVQNFRFAGHLEVKGALSETPFAAIIRTSSNTRITRGSAASYQILQGKRGTEKTLSQNFNVFLSKCRGGGTTARFHYQNTPSCYSLCLKENSLRSNDVNYRNGGVGGEGRYVAPPKKEKPKKLKKNKKI